MFNNYLKWQLRYVDDLHSLCCSCSSSAYFMSVENSPQIVEADSWKKRLVENYTVNIMTKKTWHINVVLDISRQLNWDFGLKWRLFFKISLSIPVSSNDWMERLPSKRSKLVPKLSTLKNLWFFYSKLVAVHRKVFIIQR